METRPSSSVINVVHLRRRSLRKLATTRIQSVDELFGEFMVPGGTYTLTPDDFSHLRPHLRQIKCLLDDAVRNSRRGVHVLLYGPPGTGKSERSRTLAGDHDVPLFEVYHSDHVHARIEAHVQIHDGDNAQ